MVIGIYCDSRSGERKTSLLPKRVGKTKYPLDFVSFEAQYSAWQVGGGEKKSDASLKVPGSAKHYSDLGGENYRKKVQLRL